MKVSGPYRTYADAALVSLLTRGDHDAFTEIYNRYGELLYRHAHRILGDIDACNDVVQDVFLSIWAKHEQLNIHGALATYLYKAVRNKVFDHISHERVAERYADTIRSVVEEGLVMPDERMREKELLTIIEREKAKLPPRTRKVYELNREHDLSYKEIGLQLNVSEKTVKKQVHNALRIIRLKISSLLSLFLFLF